MADVAELTIQVRDQGLAATDRNLKRVEDGFSKAEAKVVSFNQALDLVSRVQRGVNVVFGAGVRAAAAQEEAIAALNAQLRAQGRFSEEFSRGLQKQASALQATTTFADETVNAVQAILAVFPRLSDDVLPRATEGALDFATAFGTDAVSAAQTLGVALNDPSEALLRLQRAGIRFSDDQKDVLEQLVATGQTAEAQTLILDELAERMGGRAAAAARTFSGELKQLANLFDGFLEELGNSIVQSDAVRDVFATLRGELEKLTTETRDYVDANRDVIDSGIREFFADLPEAIHDTKDALGDLKELADDLAALADVPMVKYLISTTPTLKSTTKELQLINDILTSISNLPGPRFLLDLLNRAPDWQAAVNAQGASPLFRGAPFSQIPTAPAGPLDDVFNPLELSDPFLRSPQPRRTPAGRHGGGGRGAGGEDTELQRFAERVISDTLTDFEEFQRVQDQLNRALDAGLLTQEQFNRALDEAVDHLQNGSEAARQEEAAIAAARDEAEQLAQAHLDQATAIRD